MYTKGIQKIVRIGLPGDTLDQVKTLASTIRADAFTFNGEVFCRNESGVWFKTCFTLGDFED